MASGSTNSCFHHIGSISTSQWVIGVETVIWGGRTVHSLWFRILFPPLVSNSSSPYRHNINPSMRVAHQHVPNYWHFGSFNMFSRLHDSLPSSPLLQLLCAQYFDLSRFIFNCHPCTTSPRSFRSWWWWKLRRLRWDHDIVLLFHYLIPPSGWPEAVAFCSCFCSFTGGAFKLNVNAFYFGTEPHLSVAGTWAMSFGFCKWRIKCAAVWMGWL